MYTLNRYLTKGEKKETAKNIFPATLHYNQYSVYGKTFTYHY